jgi:sugar lactone lactonase YvrE
VERVTADVALEVAYDLAEGPVWDPEGERLAWVDIRTGRVLLARLVDSRVELTDELTFDGTVGAVAFATDQGLLVAATDRLVVVAPDGTRTDGPRIVPADERRRLNDGACDPQGRFLVGTCTPADEPSDRELLVRLEHDGELTTIDADLTLSNGLAWSADGSRLFSIDTLRRVVYVRAYGPDYVGPRRVHLRMDDFPDGMTIDADDHLWIAIWNAGCVRRFDPKGRLVAQIDLPAAHATCAGFAGPDLRTLVVTTATKQMTPRQRDEQPLSGMLFTARVDVPGLPAHRWRNTCT